jgi:hypothetical protein
MLSVEVVIASEAKQFISQLVAIWIASSLPLPCANAFAFVAGNDDREAASPIKAET